MACDRPFHNNLENDRWPIFVVDWCKHDQNLRTCWRPYILRKRSHLSGPTLNVVVDHSKERPSVLIIIPLMILFAVFGGARRRRVLRSIGIPIFEFRRFSPRSAASFTNYPGINDGHLTFPILDVKCDPWNMMNVDDPIAWDWNRRNFISVENST